MRPIDADELDFYFCNCDNVFECSEALSNAPTLTLDDLLPHGRWEECDWVEYDGHGECIHYPREGCVCTNCRNAFKKEFVISPRVEHCPNCGAKMDGSEDQIER